MPDTAVADALPRWDMSNVFAGLEGEDYRAALLTLDQELSDAEAWFNQHGIGRLAAPPTAADDATADRAAEALRRISSVALRYETLESYVYAFLSTNSYDPAAARETSRVELLDTRRQKLLARLRAWIGSLAALWPELIERRAELRTHAFFLKFNAEQARYQMAEELEALAAELCVDGGLAFGKLQGNVTSQLKVPFEREGRTEELPVTVIRNMSYSPDATLRERAYRAEQRAWQSVRTSVAASLNAVKGTALTLARRRGRESVLHAALDNNRIDRRTLEALLGSIREHFPTFRRYLKAKARKLGQERLAWWDLFAPVGGHLDMTWDEARRFIEEKLGTFSADMGEFARTAFARRWIDAGPRDGKRGGAFCMAVVGVDESRVLMNFDGSFEQVSTLAHELGHGYHNHCQRGLEPLRRGSPSTLAETASIFCETLVAEAAAAGAGPAERLAILETQLCNATQVCLDISSRYLFETALLERRATSELAPDEICELMRAAQRETYADAVDEATYHPYMWLWKPHYYAFAENFYNFPYAFGHLFGLGLYAVYRREGDSFPPRYTELLRATGESLAAPLAARFGIDISKADFWRGSLALIEDQVRRYEQV
jgi:pepF/M3 family oligoendopeptidase